MSKLRREYVIYDDNIASYNDEPDLAKITLAVKSGGFPSDHPVMLKCIDAGVGIASDLELFYRFFPGRKTITVTGTNGKTTTAALIAHLLPGVDLGGNIGAPLFEFADSSRPIVIEASSFMLEYCHDFRTDIAVLLNITPHHLSRHRDFLEYASAKKKIVAARLPGDVLIYNADCEAASAAAKSSPGINIPFSVRGETEGYYAMAGGIYYLGSRLLDVDAIPLAGKHNLANAVAAMAAVFAFRPGAVITPESFRGFRPFPHRIEYAGSFKGIKHYNDSKATNPAALAAALAAFPDERVLLLCGGKEEGADFSLPVGALKAVARVVVSGENRERVARFFRGAGIDTEIYPDLASALDDLERHLADVTVVLFSPGAPSYDQFNNYAERGRYFTERIMRK